MSLWSCNRARVAALALGSAIALASGEPVAAQVVRGLVTEKTTVIRDDGRTLVFQVATDANKVDIKRAVERLLGSKVQSVRTSLAHGKVKGSPLSGSCR